ncbi:MAG TPA: alpha/beta hydrolase [Verrucomicrobiaceae bacterium]
MNRLTALFVISLLPWTVLAQSPKAKGSKSAPPMTDAPVKHENKVYKKTPQGELMLHFSFPVDWKPSDKRPAIVFFFGGGWKNGSYLQFVSHSDYFASRGMVTASADYRIESIHHTTPDKCVEDAKSAVRYLRQHASELGLDPAKVVASGGSAGGHIAACTALIEAFDADSDDKSISAVPNAMVLFNPALNVDELSVERKASSEEQSRAEAITPNRFIKTGTPPAIMFFGTNDALKKGADGYLEKANPLGLRAELWTAEGQAHGFFNRAPWAQVTTIKADEFLTSLGFLKGEPTVQAPAGAPSLQQERAATAVK